MKAKLQIRLFGTLTIELDGMPIANLKTRTAEAMLVYLIAHRRPIQREMLADFFWDERPQAQASANLRGVLSRLRRQLGDYLTITRQTVAFNHDQSYWVDAYAFEAEMPAFLQADSDNGDHIHQLENLLALYRHDFLAGFTLTESQGFAEWVIVWRERLRRYATLAFTKTVTHAHEQGLYQHGLTLAERWVNVDPLNEEAHSQLMWLYARSGQMNLALAQYEKCRHLLQTNLNLAPSTTHTLYQKLQQLPAFPLVHLPPLLEPTVKQQETIYDLTNQIIRRGDTNQLITILASPDSHQTRLAQQVATHIADQHLGRFLDGIYWFPCQTVANYDGFIASLAAIFDKDIEIKSDPAPHLLVAFADREYLLVLDRFEQLVDDDKVVDFLTQWLKIAPATRLLLTSQQRLFLQAERVYSPNDGDASGKTSTE